MAEIFRYDKIWKHTTNTLRVVNRHDANLWTSRKEVKYDVCSQNCRKLQIYYCNYYSIGHFSRPLPNFCLRNKQHRSRNTKVSSIRMVELSYVKHLLVTVAAVAASHFVWRNVGAICARIEKARRLGRTVLAIRRRRHSFHNATQYSRDSEFAKVFRMPRCALYTLLGILEYDLSRSLVEES